MYFFRISVLLALVLLPLSNNAFAAGDCDQNGTVSISEVQSAINMFLGLKQLETCVDEDSSESVSIAEVQKTINSFLGLLPAGATPVVSGIVSTGLNVTDGTIFLKSKSGEVSQKIGSDGTFSFSVSPNDAPYILKAVSTANSTFEMYSYGTKTGTLNVNPLTSATVYHAAQISPRQAYNNFTQMSDTVLASSQNSIKSLLKQVLYLNGMLPGDVDLFSAPYTTNHFGYDAVLDSLQTVVSSKGAVIFPKNGVPIDLTASEYKTIAKTTAKALTENDASLIKKILDKLKPTVKDAETFFSSIIDDLIDGKNIEYAYNMNNTNPAVYVLKGASLKIFYEKAISAGKVLILDRLSKDGAITKEESDFINLLDDATFGASFLQPYINLANGKAGSGGIETDLINAFNKTRPGIWLSDPQSAARDMTRLNQYMMACQLPERIPGLGVIFSRLFDSPGCTEPENGSPVVFIQPGTASSLEGDVLKLDGSGSYDPENDELSYKWTATSDNPAGLYLLLDTNKIAYAYGSNVTQNTKVTYTLTVTDAYGASTSKTFTIPLNVLTPAPTCTPPKVLTNGVCLTPPPTCTLPQVLTNGVCVTPPPICILPQVLTNGVCVTPPPTTVKTIGGLGVSAIYPNSGWGPADTFCKSGGMRLPTFNELKSLITNSYLSGIAEDMWTSTEFIGEYYRITPSTGEYGICSGGCNAKYVCVTGGTTTVPPPPTGGDSCIPTAWYANMNMQTHVSGGITSATATPSFIPYVDLTLKLNTATLTGATFDAYIASGGCPYTTLKVVDAETPLIANYTNTVEPIDAGSSILVITNTGKWSSLTIQ